MFHKYGNVYVTTDSSYLEYSPIVGYENLFIIICDPNKRPSEGGGIMCATVTTWVNLLEVHHITIKDGDKISYIIKELIHYIESTFKNLTDNERLIKMIKPTISIHLNHPILKNEYHFKSSAGIFNEWSTGMKLVYYEEKKKEEKVEEGSSECGVSAFKKVVVNVGKNN